VGESNVVKSIIDSNYDAGGEGSSGGFILPNFTMCRDGLLAGAIISTMDKKMRDECLLIAKKYTQIRSKIPMKSNFHNTIVEKIQSKFKDSYQILTFDGIKVLIDDNSWVLVRPSNTEDALRISVESEASNAQLLYKETTEKVQNIYEQIK
jgi:phosphomannomutase